MPFVNVVPIYLSDRLTLVDQLRDCIERTFRLTTRLRAPWFDPENAFDSSRGQYNANELLRQLLSDPFDEASKVLGVVSRDLFCPVLTYIFGEAQLDGRAAVVSIERLRNEAYGLPPDDKLLRERLEKEATHELGHTYGLLHCRNTACVMHPSIYAEQIDFKSAGFCSACRRCLDASHA